MSESFSVILTALKCFLTTQEQWAPKISIPHTVELAFESTWSGTHVMLDVILASHLLIFTH